MNANVYKPFVFLMVLVMLVSMACLGSSNNPPTQPPVDATPAVQETDASATEEPVETEPPAEETEEPVEEPSGAITDRRDVKNAVIQVEAQGTFVNPDFTVSFNQAGRGSGFIISSEGIAVTNNHVVTGAGLIKVWIGGDEDKVYNAKVLGASECSDLAVIDIEGSGFPYLEWYGGDIETGEDIYVAGFPLGDPEFSLNKGVISKAEADGRTYSSSVEGVVEYDATTNPGNSGGPVVTEDGQVVAVHYQSNKDARQAFGISRDVAQEVVDVLSEGKNMEWIGVNGDAFILDDQSLSGIYVYSVQSGSPADDAGVEGGDIITTLENLVVGSDGTKGDYCDVLRSHDSGDTLGIEVLRLATGEVLQGQLNGDELASIGTIDSGTTGDSGQTTEGGVPTVNTEAVNPGDIYFQDSFDSGVDNWVYFLTSGQDGNFTQTTTDDGKFRTEIEKRDTYVYYRMEGWEFGDVRIDARVENKGANKNFVGLFCRYTEDGWYEVNINSNGEYTIWYAGDRYQLLYSGASREIRMGKDVNDYTLICKGDEITLGVNGTEVKSVPMKTSNSPLIQSGQVGMSVSSIDIVPVIVEFDDFILTVPE